LSAFGDQPGSRILVIERRFLMPGLYDGEMSRGVTRVAHSHILNRSEKLSRIAPPAQPAKTYVED
jgi:hypothetical protein